jgi:hypothetical protein
VQLCNRCAIELGQQEVGKRQALQTEAEREL